MEPKCFSPLRGSSSSGAVPGRTMPGSDPRVSVPYGDQAAPERTTALVDGAPLSLNVSVPYGDQAAPERLPQRPKGEEGPVSVSYGDRAAPEPKIRPATIRFTLSFSPLRGSSSSKTVSACWRGCGSACFSPPRGSSSSGTS